ncbi:hypothetical protein CWATWH8502_1239 [Crocosphaera watsonii WH 8502]|uniref:Uncharacterized protein n=3 Tax=Crocosphaera watsonii TaxID=263511 RepID=G5JDU9_CROWT|nr:hypothetical protein CWATWH0003_5588 [Crocosphaera watsonii WH 0003]CCQ49310.1 hypothetical protein CWATWH8502_1239 [Crocosphaera watsonii WH 8502]CCQ64532.1 hypothetical protein CWATWH0401_2276 [Crocosphaera watsonii WH 0401]
MKICLRRRFVILVLRLLDLCLAIAVEQLSSPKSQLTYIMPRK